MLLRTDLSLIIELAISNNNNSEIAGLVELVQGALPELVYVFIALALRLEHEKTYHYENLKDLSSGSLRYIPQLLLSRNTSGGKTYAMNRP